MEDLQTLMKNRIQGEILMPLLKQGEYKVLVVDGQAFKILTTVFSSMDQLHNLNIPRVSEITQTRGFSNANMDAIYFCSPSLSNIQLIVNDFSPKPKFSGAHIFCLTGSIATSNLPAMDNLSFSQLKSSPAFPFIRGLKEMNIDFIASESQLFHFNALPLDLALYAEDAGENAQEAYLDGVSNHVMSLLATLQESPAIHYFNPKGNHATMSAHLAARTNQKLQVHQEAFPDTFKSIDQFGNQSHLIIVVSALKRLTSQDRNIDAISPFLHDMHYQCLLNDCLPVDGNKVTFDTSTEQGVVAEISVGSDPLWAENRHKLFFQATQSVSLAFKTFLQENKHAVQVASGEKVDISDLVDVGRNVMSFNQEKAQFEKHINILTSLSNLVTEENLMPVSEIENSLLFGVDVDGEKVPEDQLYFDFEQQLTEESLDIYSKLRLFAVYLLATRKLKQPGDLAKLWNRACENQGENADQLFSVLVNSLRFMGADFLDDSLKMWRRYSISTRMTYPARSSDMIHVDRYKPTVYCIFEDDINDRLDHSLFPCINSTVKKSAAVVLDQGSANKGPGKIYEFKTFRPTWGAKKLIGTAVAPEDWRQNGPRIIILVLGGVCLSEARAAYEIAQKYKRQVYIGSTHSVIPISFMDQIVEYESGISLHPIVRKPEPKKQLPPVVLESQSRKPQSYSGEKRDDNAGNNLEPIVINARTSSVVSESQQQDNEPKSQSSSFLSPFKTSDDSSATTDKNASSSSGLFASIESFTGRLANQIIGSDQVRQQQQSISGVVQEDRVGSDIPEEFGRTKPLKSSLKNAPAAKTSVDASPYNVVTQISDQSSPSQSPLAGATPAPDGGGQKPLKSSLKKAPTSKTSVDSLQYNAVSPSVDQSFGQQRTVSSPDISGGSQKPLKSAFKNSSKTSVDLLAYDPVNPSVGQSYDQTHLSALHGASPGQSPDGGQNPLKSSLRKAPATKTSVDSSSYNSLDQNMDPRLSQSSLPAATLSYSPGGEQKPLKSSLKNAPLRGPVLDTALENVEAAAPGYSLGQKSHIAGSAMLEEFGVPPKTLKSSFKNSPTQNATMDPVSVNQNSVPFQPSELYPASIAKLPSSENRPLESEVRPVSPSADPKLLSQKDTSSPSSPGKANIPSPIISKPQSVSPNSRLLQNSSHDVEKVKNSIDAVLSLTSEKEELRPVSQNAAPVLPRKPKNSLTTKANSLALDSSGKSVLKSYGKPASASSSGTGKSVKSQPENIVYRPPVPNSGRNFDARPKPQSLHPSQFSSGQPAGANRPQMVGEHSHARMSYSSGNASESAEDMSVNHRASYIPNQRISYIPNQYHPELAQHPHQRPPLGPQYSSRPMYPGQRPIFVPARPMDPNFRGTIQYHGMPQQQYYQQQQMGYGGGQYQQRPPDGVQIVHQLHSSQNSGQERLSIPLQRPPQRPPPAGAIPVQYRQQFNPMAQPPGRPQTPPQMAPMSGEQTREASEQQYLDYQQQQQQYYDQFMQYQQNMHFQQQKR